MAAPFHQAIDLIAEAARIRLRADVEAGEYDKRMNARVRGACVAVLHADEVVPADLGTLICGLHEADQDRSESRERRYENLRREHSSGELSVASEFSFLADAVISIRDVLASLILELIRASDDAQITALLLDLYQLGYEEFEDTEVNELHFCAGDQLDYKDSETPRQLLEDMMCDATVSRLLRTHGRELVTCWARRALETGS